VGFCSICVVITLVAVYVPSSLTCLAAFIHSVQFHQAVHRHNCDILNSCGCSCNAVSITLHSSSCAVLELLLFVVLSMVLGLHLPMAGGVRVMCTYGG